MSKMWVRVVAALAVLVSAVVHLVMWFDGVRDQGVVGVAFMVNAVAGLVIAALLLAWRHWLPGFLTLGFGASTLGAFVVSTTVGLFGVHADWSGGYVWAAAVSEVVAIVTGAWLLAGGRSGSEPGRQHGAAVHGLHLH